MHLSRYLLLSDILIFVKIIKKMILCVAFWNASAEGLVTYRDPTQLLSWVGSLSVLICDRGLRLEFWCFLRLISLVSNREMSKI